MSSQLNDEIEVIAGSLAREFYTEPNIRLDHLSEGAKAAWIRVATKLYETLCENEHQSIEKMETAWLVDELRTRGYKVEKK